MTPPRASPSLCAPHRRMELRPGAAQLRVCALAAPWSRWSTCFRPLQTLQGCQFRRSVHPWQPGCVGVGYGSNMIMRTHTHHPYGCACALIVCTCLHEGGWDVSAVMHMCSLVCYCTTLRVLLTAHAYAQCVAKIRGCSAPPLPRHTDLVSIAHPHLFWLCFLLARVVHDGGCRNLLQEAFCR